MATLISVKNGYPGANVWVTIYIDQTFDRKQGTSGAVASGATQLFQWDSVQISGFYVRCETSVNINGADHKFSDTTARIVADNGTVTLLPGEGQNTYIAQGAQPMGTVTLNLSTGTDYLVQAAFSFFLVFRTPVGYLSADPNDQSRCVIESRSSLTDTPPPTMVWTKQDSPNGFLLTNKGTNTILYVGGGNGANAQLIPATTINQRLSLWTAAGDYPGKVAIRPSADDSQNLNVFGNGPWNPGNAVGTWAWGRGQPNEMWAFIAI
jgi:hypothetical protein